MKFSWVFYVTFILVHILGKCITRTECILGPTEVASVRQDSLYDTYIRMSTQMSLTTTVNVDASVNCYNDQARPSWWNDVCHAIFTQISSVICYQHSVTLCSGRFQLCVCSIWFFIIVYILRLTTQQYANLPATQTVHMLFTAIICWNVIQTTMLTGNPLIILRMNIKLNSVVQFQNSAVQIHGLQKEKLYCCRKTECH